MDTSTSSPASPDYNTVNGFIVVTGAARFIEFLTEVFDGTENGEAHTPDWFAGDGTLIHAEVHIGSSRSRSRRILVGLGRSAAWTGLHDVA